MAGAGGGAWRELLERDPAHPWSVVDLAARSGISVRSLQEGFRRHLDTTPTAHSAPSASTAPMLLLLFGSGNRDPEVFDRADEMDLDRDNVRDHLAFGSGIHECPGAPLARTEIRVALEELFRRKPTVQLDQDYEPTYIASYFFRGLESLDVTW